MGQGEAPYEKIKNFITKYPNKPVKLNVVMCPENTDFWEIFSTLVNAMDLGIKTINYREPYGQPHIGRTPLEQVLGPSTETVYGMPAYRIGDTLVTYWDVHFVEVESVNLYANGVISKDYPVTRGHSVATVCMAKSRVRNTSLSLVVLTNNGYLYKGLDNKAKS